MGYATTALAGGILTFISGARAPLMRVTVLPYTLTKHFLTP